MLATKRMTAAWKVTRGTVARRLFLDRQARFWAGRIGDRWARHERARVVAVVEEAPDVKSFFLRPGAAWRGHRAGQYTTVTVEVGGVQMRRCYTVSSAPGDPLLRITVKRSQEGRVSTWLHDRLRAGDLLRISAPAGDFVLPDVPPAKLLFVTGGSGVTPAMSILRDLDARDAVGDVVLVHYARSKKDVIFAGELHEVAARHAGLRLVFAFDDAAAGQGAFSEAGLAAAVPDFATRATYLCGPPGLMARVERMWEAAGATSSLKHERFVAPAMAAPPRRAPGEARALTVHLARSGKRCAVSDAGTLLEELERAGERPRHGCRMGICRTCTCVKRAGIVRNLVTGAVSSDPDEEIQLCISAPLSDLELGL